MNIKKLFAFPKRLFFLFLLTPAIFAILFLDRQMLHLITPVRASGGVYLKVLSCLIFPPLYLVGSTITFFLFRFLKPHSKLHQVFFEIASVQCLSVAVVRLSKVLIGRARPDTFLKKGIYGCYGISLDTHFHSFPSGHTMAAFTLATSLALLYPRYRILFLLCALVLSLSRVLLTDHYFSDVFGTACLGIGIATLTHKILRNILGLKCFP